MALLPSAAGSPAAGADPTLGAGAPAPDDTGGDTDTDVVVTICRAGDGSWMVYAGDEPDAGGGAGMSADDGGAPAGAASQGQPAESVGQALKAAMDIMNSSSSGDGADQMSAGFSADKSPTPAAGSPMGQKY